MTPGPPPGPGAHQGKNLPGGICGANLREVCELGRRKSPCGTEAAYRRHLREKTTVCAECRQAHRVERRKASKPKITPEMEKEIVEAVEQLAAENERSREGDLLKARDALVESLERAKIGELRAVAGISKELRELWKDLADISDVEEEDDPLARFNNGKSGGALAIV